VLFLPEYLSTIEGEMPIFIFCLLIAGPKISDPAWSSKGKTQSSGQSELSSRARQIYPAYASTALIAHPMTWPT
jgi:hypothetical protein